MSDELCISCGATVMRGQMIGHAGWHQKIEARLANLENNVDNLDADVVAIEKKLKGDGLRIV